jgi:uncharacterized membrane protein
MRELMSEFKALRLHGMAGAFIAPWILWLRLPFQLVLIAWVVHASLSQRPSVH